MKQVLNTLKQISPPKMIREALALYGTIEDMSSKSNPIILGWVKEVGGDVSWYNDDSIAWCGLWMSVVAKRAGKEVPKESLRAKAWDKFGTKVSEAILGDILIFNRNGGGHVGLYVGETTDSYYVLGGNQSDKVSITRIAKSRLYSIQRPEYKIKMPDSCKKYFYTAEGNLSEN